MDRNIIWYDRPAGTWTEGLPLGNGYLGAMCYGGTAIERIQLNDDSLWYGGFRDRVNPQAKEALPKIRQLLREGRIEEAEHECLLRLSGTPESQRHHETLGDLILYQKVPSNRAGFNPLRSLDNDSNLKFCNLPAEGYRRQLDFIHGIAQVQYRLDDIDFSREMFINHPHNVMAVKVDGGAFDVLLRRGRYLEGVYPVSDNTLALTGRMGGRDGMSFVLMVRALGRVEVVGECICCKGPVTLLVAAGTSFRYADPLKDARQRLDAAEAMGYDALRAEHEQDMVQIMERCSLRLDGPGASDLPIDKRLERLRQGESDYALIGNYFQYGRYLLVACSRPGTLPATLQGLWNQEFLPPWDSKYTININTQMNYWHANVCNLAQMELPLFDLLERMKPNGEKVARDMYDARGWVAHHNTDIYGDCAPQDVYIPASYWAQGAAFLCLHIMEHYRFTQDCVLLKRCYPLLRDAALYYVDVMFEDGKGRLVTGPSVSPENTYRLPNGQTGSLCVGASMDSQMLWQLFGDTLEAADILGEDIAQVEVLRDMRARLPQPQIGRHGQLMEWSEDYEEVEPGHRHISHLFALHPGHQISVTGMPDLARAARVTLERRLQFGGGHTGWSCAWIVNMWARLLDGKLAGEALMKLLRQSTVGSLLDNHPPFQIDGNFGGTAGIAEMLLQSQDGVIHLLPALPPDWGCGEVRGLIARGGATVSVHWVDGVLTQAHIAPLADGPVALRHAGALAVYDGEECIARGAAEDVLEFFGRSGKTYRVTLL